MSTIVLVACVGKKLDERAQAAEMYQSAWFKKARKYAEKQGCPWYILSAKYGLLHPESWIKPYDTTLREFSPWGRVRWAIQVTKGVMHELWRDDRFRRISDSQTGQPTVDDYVPADRIVILAGRLYREDLEPLLRKAGYQVETPLEGLGIGRQLAWFDKNTEED
jgi:hypothetical protein